MHGSFLKGAAVGFVCAVLGGATVALAGSGIGGVFNLGVSNSVDAKTTLTGASPSVQLQVTNTSSAAGTSGLAVNSASAATTGVFTNTGGGSAGRFLVNAGVQPFTVNSQTRVANLNADLLDGLNSTGFLRNLVPLSLTGATASNGVVSATNVGSANGLQGKTGSPTASGVYGENTGGGFGVAGRSGNGVGVYGEAIGGANAHGVSALSDGPGGTVLATNQGGGPALELHSNGPPLSVDSSVKVDNLNADKVGGLDTTQLVIGDQSPGAAARGGRIFANRLAPAVDGQRLLIIPGWGQLIVDKCDDSVGRLAFDAQGTGNFDLMYSGLVSNNPGTPAVGDTYAIITNQWWFPSSNSYFGPTRVGAYTLSIARQTWNSTRILTIWVSWDASGCRFQAQALESPQA